MRVKEVHIGPFVRVVINNPEELIIVGFFSISLKRKEDYEKHISL